MVGFHEYKTEKLAPAMYVFTIIFLFPGTDILTPLSLLDESLSLLEVAGRVRVLVSTNQRERDLLHYTFFRLHYLHFQELNSFLSSILQLFTHRFLSLFLSFDSIFIPSNQAHLASLLILSFVILKLSKIFVSNLYFSPSTVCLSILKPPTSHHSHILLSQSPMISIPSLTFSIILHTLTPHPLLSSPPFLILYPLLS